MERHEDTGINEQDPGSSASDASTISCPNSPTRSSRGAGIADKGSIEELAEIQEELQNVLEYVDHGMILKSFEALSRLTDIAVANCENLGLASDSASIGQKAGFWTGLNNCWLFAISHYGNARSEDQRLQEPHLHHLYNSVKTWADALEKYGLVNYELGFWEQDILETIEVCLINAIVDVPPIAVMDPDEDEEDDDGDQDKDEK
ncbi:hypothetical protein BC939DRAFT_458588 [Gamsiella multidivaricata]|uniref:uncharacterized protein n=1 Tax=Gamsiella multidivaricata TaxID=101098 RepID=UPI00221F2274|nr:uncharacterized protein BC939DRAFT_458588 [Gamsiella multidivaricata]KAG0367639.1 hypothetical protein BGZ54_003517 [Gamsiella multidivaricata]KAI7820192.1 hypothetical protein BC939DRAFT_458588 [Gamsiella multidivaricata]